ncbi:MAG: DUF2513 domain-containing protein [Alphaproteobacteria bacterium]
MAENFAIPDQDDAVVMYHLEIMVEGGLVSAIDGTTMQARAFMPLRLTWAGHEVLDVIRDPGIWEQTKAGGVKVGGFGLDLLKALAKGYVKKKAMDLTGMEIDL